ncbi:MAG TPA: CHAP domain-containing protein [Anaeromyxobacter sp.]
MARARPAAVLPLLALAVAACAGPRGAGRGEPDLSLFDLQARLAARAASLVGHTAGFRVGGERFNADCTGFVEAVYADEGVPLRPLMRSAAPEERSGVRAAYRAIRRFGVVFGGGGEWPAPGDLVFWRDTYDRNRNGKADDGLTHLGIVEYVVDGTVVFVHRGAHGVARGAMTPDRPDERSAAGVALNSTIRARDPRLSGVPGLAGELFAGYGRLDPAKLPRPLDVAARPPTSRAP